MMIVALTASVVAILMDRWAALLHQHVWHRTLWRWHAPHHRGKPGLNRNDALSASHAPIAIALVVAGGHFEGLAADVALGTGLGMTIFGAAYVLVHDGYVHGRLPLRFLERVPYFRRVRRAHERHHARGGAPYSFFTALDDR
jgi:beta-carotene 3-hydroxylase